MAVSSQRSPSSALPLSHQNHPRPPAIVWASSADCSPTAHDHHRLVDEAGHHVGHV